MFGVAFVLNISDICTDLPKRVNAADQASESNLVHPSDTLHLVALYSRSGSRRVFNCLGLGYYVGTYYLTTQL